jgi:hypothetical protein
MATSYPMNRPTSGPAALLEPARDHDPACSQARGYAGGAVSGYSGQEVAQRAGVEPGYVDRLVELEILSPAAAEVFSCGDVLRARWLQSLERAGVPLEGLAAAVRDGVVLFAFLEVGA